MSLIVINESNTIESNALVNGPHTCHSPWFVDTLGQVYVRAMDDRNGEMRIVCVGDYCSPFIADIETERVLDKKPLAPGTMLEIVQISSRLNSIPKGEE